MPPHPGSNPSGNGNTYRFKWPDRLFSLSKTEENYENFLWQVLDFSRIHWFHLWNWPSSSQKMGYRESDLQDSLIIRFKLRLQIFTQDLAGCRLWIVLGGKANAWQHSSELLPTRSFLHTLQRIATTFLLLLHMEQPIFTSPLVLHACPSVRL